VTGADGFDAVVVGSGPNGLVGAVRLAEAGMRVLLVEAADRLGGGLRTEELTLPGFHHDVCATALPLAVASPAFRAIDPTRDGVEFLHAPIPVAHPLDGRTSALVHRDVDATAAAFGRDATAWHATLGETARSGLPLVDTLLAPLDLPRAPLALARYGVLGALPATAVAQLFRDPVARAAFGGMAAHAILDLHAPVTAGYGMLIGALAHSVGWPLVRGGTQSLADGLASRLRGLGAEIVTGQRVRDLADLPPAPVTLLGLTPRQLLEIGRDRLPVGYRRRLERYRYGSGVFKIDYALDAPVPWADPAVGEAGTVHIGGTFEEVAASERAIARGGHPDRPFVLGVQGAWPTRPGPRWANTRSGPTATSPTDPPST